MDRAVGILTARGGQTSHAAVVARGMGKCCVAGADCCQINYATKTLVIGDRKFKEGDFISINGTTGEIYNGAVQTIEPGITDDLQTIMDWSDKYRVLKIRTNADTPTTLLWPVSLAQRASGFAGQSTCSSRPTASWQCAR